MSVAFGRVAKGAASFAARRLKQLKRRFAPGCAILLYHRVAAPATDPQRLCVEPDLFSQHLEVIRRAGRVMSLTQLLDALARGRLPRRALVVTFDDGYLDNLRTAKPLLERHGVPATVFVSSGPAASLREFFWDELDRLLLHTAHPPGVLRVKIRNSEHVWMLETGEISRDWNVTRPPRFAHERVYAELCTLMKPLLHAERAAVMDQVRVQALRAPEADPAMMTAEQWCELVDGGTVEIGAHTVTHPMLSQLPEAEQDSELRASKAALEERLGRRVRTMAYPFGGREDYTDTTIRLAREAGYEGACSNCPGLVSKHTDHYELPRFLVRNWPAHELEQRIEEGFRV